MARYLSEILEPDWVYDNEYTFDIEGTFKAKITVSDKTPEKAREQLENCRDLKRDWSDYDIEDLQIEDIGGWTEE